MKGIALQYDSGGWNVYECSCDSPKLLSPKWTKQKKVEEPGYVEEFDKQTGKKVKRKGLVRKVVGTYEVTGESLAMAMGRARQLLAEMVVEGQRLKR